MKIIVNITDDQGILLHQVKIIEEGSAAAPVTASLVADLIERNFETEGDEDEVVTGGEDRKSIVPFAERYMTTDDPDAGTQD